MRDKYTRTLEPARALAAETLKVERRQAYATWASGTIHRPDRPRMACRGFSRVGQEGDFGCRTGNRK
jgi:hypothetical protein